MNCAGLNSVPPRWSLSSLALGLLKPEDHTLEIGANIVKPTDIVRDLSVLLDSKLNMKQHVSKTVSTCFYHLCRLWQLRRQVDIDTMKQLVAAFIFSRLDYCNAVLYGLPQSTIGPLQRVQNAADRATLCLSPTRHHMIYLRALISWQNGQLSLLQGTETKKLRN